MLRYWLPSSPAICMKLNNWLIVVIVSTELNIRLLYCTNKIISRM